MFVMLSLSVSTPDKLKSLLDHGGNQTRDLWFASPVLYQLSYEVKSVRVRGISELSLANVSAQCGHTQSNITNICLHLSAQHQKQVVNIFQIGGLLSSPLMNLGETGVWRQEQFFLA